jgi:hypothetical protein
VLAKTSSTDYDTNWTTLGTLATQNANAVAVTGGTIDDTAIGSTTPDAGTFTQVAVTTGAGSSAFNNNDTITGWNYSGKSFSITAQETSPTGLFIGSSGTKVYVNGTTGDDVNEYTLSTAWDITTASFVGVFSTAAQDTAPTDLFFAPDGLTMYVVGDTNNIVFQYTLSTAWSIATASYASKSFSVSTQESTPSGLWFKPDGTQMYVVGSTTDAVYQYTLSTAWDVSTASYSGIFYSVAQQETSPQQINLNADGTKMWVAGNVGDDIWEYSLSSAWNVSTATPINNFYIGFQDTAPTGLFIDSTAANRVYMVGSTTDFIYQYNTATNSLKLDTAKLYVDGVLSVNDNLVAGQNAYVDNTLTVQGATTLSSLTITGSINANNNTSSLALGTAQTTGTWAAGSTTQTGTMTFGQSTASQTTNIQAGATASGSTKTLNIGTAGLSGSTTNISIGSAVSGSLGTATISAPTVNIGQTGTQLSVTNTASAVNYVQVTGAATAGIPAFSAQGSDANISLALTSKGTGSVRITNAGSISNPALSFSNINRGFYDPATGEIGVVGAGWEQFRFGNTPTTVNYGKASGAAAGAAPVFSVAGTDTNIALAIQSKGTGAIDLAAGSSGVNISNGNTVTAITRTAVGFGYTSIPTVTVSVPTTAGGVQATASASQMFASSANVAGGGTGYAVNDVLTVAGGTPTIATQLTVTSVSAGVITAVSIVGNTGGYTVLPSNPVSVTGGTGTGATFTINYGVTSVAITNAGSGYVEQPTVTFSGGGGSGAAAYASVGAGSIIRALGSTGTQSLDFSTPASSTSAIPALRLRDPTVAADSYPMFWNGAGYTTMYAQGNANASLFIGANGTGAIRFQTNGTSGFEQMRVVHTASAVNYVQVTGAGTGAQPLVSTQGTDANISMSFTSKGTGSLNFWTNNSGTRQFSISNTDSAVNFVQVTGAATGARPVISAQGSDTNIGLTFTAKGTGIHAFNNGTGTQLVLQTGPTSSVNRIEITPSITNSAPIIASGGTDTNIDLALTPKGTGNVRFGTYTGTVLTPTGYVEIKDSGGTIRRLLVG